MTAKEFILLELQNSQAYCTRSINDLENIIDTFFRVLDHNVSCNELSGIGERILSCINSLASEAISRDDLIRIYITLNSTELYAKKVLYMTDVNTYNSLAEDAKNFTFFPVIDALNLSNSKTKSILARRNNSIHNCELYTNEKMYQSINTFLADYISITEHKMSELKYVLEGHDSNVFQSYTYQIVNSYDNHFLYTDFYWTEKENFSFDTSVEDLISNPIIKDGGAVKIIGEAGSGKTTALKRIQYVLSQNFIANKINTIPVYIALGELNGTKEVILSKIIEILDLDRFQVQDLLATGNIVLLLDGYNEILNYDVQKIIATEIDKHFSIFYPKTKIIVSDRTVSRVAIPMLSHAVRLFLKEITLNEKLTFFRERTSSDIFILIDKHAQRNPHYFDVLNTPYKMMQFLQVVKDTKSIPNNPTEGYLDILLEREQNEKKEVEMRHMSELLQFLAYYMHQHESKFTETNLNDYTSEISLPRIKVLHELTRAREWLGYHLDTAHLLDTAIGMQILCEEQNTIRFYSRDYMNYFWLKGIINGLNEIYEETEIL